MKKDKHCTCGEDNPSTAYGQKSPEVETVRHLARWV